MSISCETLVRMRGVDEVASLAALMYARLSLTELRRLIATGIRWRPNLEAVLVALDARAVDVMARFEADEDATADDVGNMAQKTHDFCRETRLRLFEMGVHT
jgi:hypothetical protein